jgi:hypothetical protein
VITRHRTFSLAVQRCGIQAKLQSRAAFHIRAPLNRGGVCRGSRLRLTDQLNSME